MRDACHPFSKNIYNSFVERYRSTNRPLPKQNPDRSKAHRLDCAFLNYSIEFLALLGQPVDSVRAVFMEGDRLFPDSAIFDLAHVQIAIRNPALIIKIEIIEI